MNTHMPAKIDRTGETNIMNCGLSATIIHYNTSHDITIQFTDGTIIQHKSYHDFQKGSIANPNKPNNAYRQHRVHQFHIGETTINNRNHTMTIIRYGNNRDIDVRFEDDAIAQHKAYSDFKKGAIQHPNDTRTKHERIGEQNRAINGMLMTIIKYQNHKDIDIQFEDGFITYHKAYKEFKNGKIKHPNHRVINNPKQKENQKTKTGEISFHKKSNQTITLIKYSSCKNVTVRFEDGRTLDGIYYQNFKSGTIAPPSCINNITLKKFAYRYHDDWYYICSHPDWTEDRIMSVKEIYAYNQESEVLSC